MLLLSKVDMFAHKGSDKERVERVFMDKKRNLCSLLPMEINFNTQGERLKAAI